MRVESGRNEDHLRTEGREPWQPDFVDDLPHDVALGSGRKRHVHHVFRRVVGAGVRIKRMLEKTDHQHALVVCQDLLGSVAVMNIEINHRDPLETVHLEGMARADRDVVQEAEAIAAALRAWWPGGRTAQNALASSLRSTQSAASITAPAERSAAFHVCGFIDVSGSTGRYPCCGTLVCSRSMYRMSCARASAATDAGEASKCSRCGAMPVEIR